MGLIPDTLKTMKEDRKKCARHSRPLLSNSRKRLRRRKTLGCLQCRFLEGLLIQTGRQNGGCGRSKPGSRESLHLIPATGTCCCLRILLNSSMYCTIVSAGL